jgi:hypothetical protein
MVEVEEGPGGDWYGQEWERLDQAGIAAAGEGWPVLEEVGEGSKGLHQKLETDSFEFLGRELGPEGGGKVLEEEGSED